SSLLRVKLVKWNCCSNCTESNFKSPLLNFHMYIFITCLKMIGNYCYKYFTFFPKNTRVFEVITYDSKMEKFKIALEQLKHISTLSPPLFPTQLQTSQTTDPSKRPKPSIPDDLDLNNVYNPRYTVVQLISIHKKPRKQAIPPRPPNSFFLFKNCYILELRGLGYRYRMPDVCHQTKQIWSNIPSEVKERYENLALQAQILHQEMYPEYKYSPARKGKK